MSYSKFGGYPKSYCKLNHACGLDRVWWVDSSDVVSPRQQGNGVTANEIGWLVIFFLFC